MSSLKRRIIDIKNQSRSNFRNNHLSQGKFENQVKSFEIKNSSKIFPILSNFKKFTLIAPSPDLERNNENPLPPLNLTNFQIKGDKRIKGVQRK